MYIEEDEQEVIFHGLAQEIDSRVEAKLALQKSSMSETFTVEVGTDPIELVTALEERKNCWIFNSGTGFLYLSCGENLTPALTLSPGFLFTESCYTGSFVAYSPDTTIVTVTIFT